MGQKSNLPSRDVLKDQAKRLRSALEKTDDPVNHSRALELVAQQYGFRDWNTLSAALGNGPEGREIALGDTVSGNYLKQPFSGEVVGLQRLSAGRRRLTIQFEKPVDVVSFESFSAFRKRVTVVVDQNGRSLEKTSDKVPHLVIQ